MAMATVTRQLLHNLILRPLHHHPTVVLRPTSLSLHRTSRPVSTTFPLHCTLQEEIKVEKIDDDINDNDDGGIGNVGVVNKGLLVEKREVPELSVKEKKELGSYANSLGDKLKSQQVGKSGVTENVFFALNETLEKRELLKLKIHKSCPGELEDVVRQLEQGTGSVVVGQIGRTVILYRPSLTKLKTEQKKEQNRKLFEEKRRKFQAASMARKSEQFSRRPGQDNYRSRRPERVSSEF